MFPVAVKVPEPVKQVACGQGHNLILTSKHGAGWSDVPTRLLVFSLVFGVAVSYVLGAVCWLCLCASCCVCLDTLPLDELVATSSLQPRGMCLHLERMTMGSSATARRRKQPFCLCVCCRVSSLQGCLCSLLELSFTLAARLIVRSTAIPRLVATTPWQSRVRQPFLLYPL